MSLIALIPARSGSKRVPHKNIKELAEHPLIAYTIQAAKDADIFDRIICSTDSEEIAEIAGDYGAEVPFLRPEQFAKDDSPEYDFIKYTLNALDEKYRYFTDLRPTNPFRIGETIKRAWQEFQDKQPCDSLRAIEIAKQTPYKMWNLTTFLNQEIKPLTDSFQYIFTKRMSDAYNLPKQSLPTIYIQNACIEIAHTNVIDYFQNVSGKRIFGFLTEGYEGFDINTPEDWILAEALIERGLAKLPEIR